MKRIFLFLLLVLALVLLLESATALGQSVKQYGGAGFFRIGYANLHQIGRTLTQLNPSLPTPSTNDFVYIGGEGYARLDKIILGAGGYGMARRSFGSSTYYAEPFCGGGYLYIGRVVVDTHRFWLYPLAGVGGTVVGMTQSQQQGTSTSESSAILPNINAQLGLGADWLMATFGEDNTYGGVLLGLRAGYQMSPYSTGWKTTGDLLGTDRPRYATNGFFVTLTVGVGAFRRTPNP
ncbi:hypothetical protein [Spirosoma panaciterrae]|uniref:hypothetical protein n=1 Tax=Spirosoma panaciterrae TaxID=496058 RepID=UPI000362D750|nr:hypothetical protein [Spirosoma panaciterrae]